MPTHCLKLISMFSPDSTLENTEMAQKLNSAQSLFLINLGNVFCSCFN